MFKNTASQKLTVFCFDSTTNLPKTGDAANLTAYRSLDDGTVTVLADTSATEKDATNAKGYYDFDLSQAETNADKIVFTCKSATANIVCICSPDVVYTLPANFTTLAIASSTGVVKATDTSGNALLIAGSNAATTFASLTITGAFSIGGVSHVPQTGDTFARVGPTGSGLTSLAQASVWTSSLATALATTNTSVAGMLTGANVIRAYNEAGAALGTYAQAAAIKTKTDQLTFTVPNKVDASATSGRSITLSQRNVEVR